jgi:hypothetical protein
MDKVNQLRSQRVLEGTVGQGEMRIYVTAQHNPPGGSWRATLNVKIVKSNPKGRAVVYDVTKTLDKGGSMTIDARAPIEQNTSYTISMLHDGAYNYRHELDIHGTFHPQNK